MFARPRVVLSDLDDTLFDHAGATRDALAVVQQRVACLQAWTLDTLDQRHRRLLELLHTEVLAGNVSIESARVERFRRLLAEAAADSPQRPAEGLAIEMASCYRAEYEQHWRLVTGALALVRTLKQSGVAVVVVTNNHVSEQRLKLDRCGLAPWIDGLVTSEESGVAKPHAQIFHDALARVDAVAAESVMLGDAWATDIEGARGAGIRPVWLNRASQSSPDASVAELTSLEPTASVLSVLLGGR